MLLNLACFVYIGASIPFSSFNDAALGLSLWRMVLLGIAILVLRRLPFVVALKPLIPALTTYRDAAFTGWFGPIGVGAVFFSKLTAMMTSPAHLGEHANNIDRLNRVREVIFAVVMFLVFASVMVHGITVPLLHLQYKYTRTWSRKREDSNHAVTRLPHINIGDEIILRPPTANGSIAEGEGEQKTVGYDHQRSIGYDNQRSIGYDRASIGYDHQRSIGYDNQRSIGYDNQRSVNQRSYGGTIPYTGFGIAGVPDFGRTNSNNNTVRTLQDVVKEMKDANRNMRGSTSAGPASPISGPRDSLSISFNLPTNRGGSQAAASNISGGTISPENEKEIAQSLKENHPAINTAIPHASDIRFDPPESPDSASPGPRPTSAAHQRPSATLVKIHEVEQEQDNGVVKTVSNDMDEKDRVRVTQEVLEEEDAGMGSRSSNNASDSGHRHHHLTDLFKQHEE